MDKTLEEIIWKKGYPDVSKQKDLIDALCAIIAQTPDEVLVKDELASWERLIAAHDLAVSKAARIELMKAWKEELTTAPTLMWAYHRVSSKHLMENLVSSLDKRLAALEGDKGEDKATNELRNSLQAEGAPKASKLGGAVPPSSASSKPKRRCDPYDYDW